MSTTTQNYSEYTVTLSTDQASYGCPCTDEQAAVIAKTLGGMLETQFPGVVVRFSSMGDNIAGPDQNTLDDIFSYIQENWTAAL